MGNCNFKAEKDKDSVNGTLPSPDSLYSDLEEPVLVLVCDRARGLWKSLES
jgi:hypothetical protein